MAASDMALDELVAGIRAAGGTNLVGIVLYGSAAGRDYHGPTSDHNVLVLVRDAGVATLRGIAPVVGRWVDGGNPPPLVLTRAEWERRADVFAIEYTDLIDRHRVLFGELPLSGVRVRRRDLRVQLESEAMGKLLRFRRGLMSAAGHADRLRALLGESLAPVLVLLRATLHLHGEPPAASSDALCDRVAALAGFNAAALHALLAHRRSTQPIANTALDGVVDGYLEALERLVHHVDTIRADD